MLLLGVVSKDRSCGRTKAKKRGRETSAPMTISACRKLQYSESAVHQISIVIAHRTVTVQYSHVCRVVGRFQEARLEQNSTDERGELSFTTKQ